MSLNPIGKLVEAKKITDKQFANILKTTISNAQKCEVVNLPTLATIKKVARLLNASPMKLADQFSYYHQHKDVVKRTFQSDSISHYLSQLRRQHHLSQTKLAKKVHMAQTDISRIEHYNPSLKTMLKLTRFYRIPLINMLKRSPRFNNINPHSPAYHILNLFVIRNLNLKELAKKSNLSVGYLKGLIYYKRSKHDAIYTNLAERIVKPLNLPVSYFGHVKNYFAEVLKNYKHSDKALTPQDFGYRLELVRCKRHITLADIANRLGMTRERIENITWNQHLTDRVMNRIIKVFSRPEDRKFLTHSKH